MWWMWVLAAGLFMLAALLFFLLYRKAKLALEYGSNPVDALTVDGIAVLLGELEATGEAIVERLEAKQREVDQLLKLLDTKLELLQVSLTLKSGHDAPEQRAEPTAAPSRALLTAEKERNITGLGEKQQLVMHWWQQGLSPVEIAQKTNLKLDEVRLMLSLLQSSASTK